MMKCNAAVIFVLVYSIAMPAVLLLWWKKRTGIRLWCFIAGAICFPVFALFLESFLHAVCLSGENAFSRAILSSPVLFTLYAGLAAGLFEETGRLFGYKLLLRSHHEKECAVAYGIGHGGTEVLYILGINYLLFLLAQLGVTVGTGSASEQLLATANAITWGSAAVAMFERLSAMMLHIGLSMIMFVAAKQKGRLWLYPVAVLLHALADTPAALYQYQGTPSIAVIELAAFLLGLAYLLAGKRLLEKYRRPQTAEAEKDGRI